MRQFFLLSSTFLLQEFDAQVTLMNSRKGKLVYCLLQSIRVFLLRQEFTNCDTTQVFQWLGIAAKTSVPYSQVTQIFFSDNTVMWKSKIPDTCHAFPSLHPTFHSYLPHSVTVHK